MARLSAWDTAERRALDFLRHGPLVRRSSGWRFGTARIGDGVVKRLLTSGQASLVSGEVRLPGIDP